MAFISSQHLRYVFTTVVLHSHTSNSTALILHFRGKYCALYISYRLLYKIRKQSVDSWISWWTENSLGAILIKVLFHAKTSRESQTWGFAACFIWISFNICLMVLRFALSVGQKEHCADMSLALGKCEDISHYFRNFFTNSTMSRLMENP